MRCPTEKKLPQEARNTARRQSYESQKAVRYPKINPKIYLATTERRARFHKAVVGMPYDGSAFIVSTTKTKTYSKYSNHQGKTNRTPFSLMVATLPRELHS